jgi:2-oxoglutarate ferredoxin oxidoreductase subunit gamma
MQERMIFSGFGGQGLITAGKLLVACAMSEGKHVTYFPSYGGEVRGGTANCQVVVSDGPILSPVVEEATGLLIMNEPSMERFLPMLAPGGLVVLNTSMVDAPRRLDGREVLGVSATETATELGNVQVANMIMLSALNEARGIVKPRTLHDALVEALSGRREKTIPANEKALEAGRKFASEWMAKQSRRK